MKPFIKWAGGKRWLTQAAPFRDTEICGRYFEPFLGGGAIFFHLSPKQAVLSDVNARLIETYEAIKHEATTVQELLLSHHQCHSKTYYYAVRASRFASKSARAAQFLYLNRTCWNGLYRENQSGEFNVPIGTKTIVYDDAEDFTSLSRALASSDLRCCDFEETLGEAVSGDFVFCDPPYTTAHNLNGFVKYNQKMFTWEDQIRLRDAALRARGRGASVVITNADHPSVRELYETHAEIVSVERVTVISGQLSGRGRTSEILVVL